MELHTRDKDSDSDVCRWAEATIRCYLQIVWILNQQYTIRTNFLYFNQEFVIHNRCDSQILSHPFPSSAASPQKGWNQESLLERFTPLLCTSKVPSCPTPQTSGMAFFFVGDVGDSTSQVSSLNAVPPGVAINIIHIVQSSLNDYIHIYSLYI